MLKGRDKRDEIRAGIPALSSSRSALCRLGAGDVRCDTRV